MTIKKPSPLQIMLMLIVGSLVLILLTGGLFFYYVFFAIIFITTAMYVLLQFNASWIVQNIKMSESHIIKGQEIQAKLFSRNDGILSIAHGHLKCSLYNQRKNYNILDLEQSFLPGVTLQKTASFQMNKRGIFTDIAIETSLEDPLRMFTKSFVHRRSIDLIVYPKVYDLTYFYVPSMGSQGTHRALHFGQEDFSNIKKVRPYHLGDNIKRIHWKLSSKRGDIFVKEYESTASSKVYLMLDAHSENYLHDHHLEIEDRAVEVAASVSKYTLKNNIETMLIYENKNIIKHESKDLSKFDTLLKSLVDFSSCGKAPFPELIHEESKQMEQNAILILITPIYSDVLMETIMGLKNRRFNISLLIINEKPLARDKKEFVEAMGIRLYEITSDTSMVNELEAFK